MVVAVAVETSGMAVVEAWASCSERFGWLHGRGAIERADIARGCPMGRSLASLAQNESVWRIAIVVSALVP